MHYFFRFGQPVPSWQIFLWVLTIWHLRPPKEKRMRMFVSTTTGQRSMLGMGNIALWLPSMYNFYLLMLLLAFILPFGFIITIKSANYCWCYPFSFLFWLQWFDGIEKLITSCWLFIWSMLLIFFILICFWPFLPFLFIIESFNFWGWYK